MSKRRTIKRKVKGKGKGRSSAGHQSAPSLRANAVAKPLLQQATTHQVAGRYAQSRELYQKATVADPKCAEAHFGLGQAIGRLGNPKEGIRHTQVAINLAPREPRYHASLADLLFTLVQCDESMAAARRALDLDERCLTAYYVLANNLERLLRFDDGLACLQKAESIAPQEVYTQVMLARLERRNKNNQAALARLTQLWESGQAKGEYERRALFEWASVLDRLGKYDEAYKAIEQYGQSMSATPAAKRWDRTARPRRIESYQNALTPELFEKWSSDNWKPDVQSAPTFLVGFPRSGTTMTEQILAAHADIITADERPFFSRVRSAWARMVGPNDADVYGMFDRLTVENANDLRQLYWECVHAECAQADVQSRVFVDKLPLNIMDLGLINAVFPDAKVIVALRDPRDVCLSCIMQDFVLNNAMIHFLTLPDTAAFYAQVMGLYLSLRDKMTLGAIEVRYEDTVSDLESQARRILQLLDLEWDQSVLDFHTKVAGKAISTPSFEAVAQPVHRGAIGRWAHYMKPFEAVRPLLDPFVSAFGYSPNEDVMACPTEECASDGRSEDV